MGRLWFDSCWGRRRLSGDGAGLVHCVCVSLLGCLELA